jgi:hypothetical protein
MDKINKKKEEIKQKIISLKEQYYNTILYFDIEPIPTTQSILFELALLRKQLLKQQIFFD